MLSLLAQASGSVTEASEQVLGVDGFDGFVDLALGIWSEGGWLMYPLCGLAFFIYFEAMAIVLLLGSSKVHKVSRDTWAQWLDNPATGIGHVGDVIRFVIADGLNIESPLRVEAVKARLIPSITQKITVLSVLVAIAPLMGLLGTVIGMLDTFRGLATSTGQSAELVAEGIRVALITTQTGLLIAIPGYIFLALVVRKRNQYLAFLAQLESAVVQRVHHLGQEDAA